MRKFVKKKFRLTKREAFERIGRRTKTGTRAQKLTRALRNGHARAKMDTRAQKGARARKKGHARTKTGTRAQKRTRALRNEHACAKRDTRVQKQTRTWKICNTLGKVIYKQSDTINNNLF